MQSPIRTKIVNESNRRFVFFGIGDKPIVLQAKGGTGDSCTVNGDVFSLGRSARACDDLLNAMLQEYITISYDIDAAYDITVTSDVLKGAEYRMQDEIKKFRERKARVASMIKGERAEAVKQKEAPKASVKPVEEKKAVVKPVETPKQVQEEAKKEEKPVEPVKETVTPVKETEKTVEVKKEETVEVTKQEEAPVAPAPVEEEPAEEKKTTAKARKIKVN